MTRRILRTITTASAIAALAAPTALARPADMPPAAAADVSHGHGRHAAVMPVHKIAGAPAGEVMGQQWVEFYADGPPPDPCVLVGHRRTALTIGHTGETNTCNVDRRTQLVVFGPSNACSDVEEDPYFGEDEAAQRLCAADGDYEFVQDIQVSVDGQPPVQIRRPRFEIFTPQMTAELPEDNFLGIPAQTAHLVGHQWVAQVRKLRPGQHTITVDVVTTEFSATSTFILNISRGR
jgi:hypothetical protein